LKKNYKELKMSTVIPKTSTLPPYPDYTNPNQQAYWQSSQDFDIGMTTFQGEQNDVIDAMNTAGTEVSQEAANAEQSANDAAASAQEAIGATNYKGDWVPNYDTTGYDTGESVTNNSSNFVSKIDNNLTEPLNTDANWLMFSNKVIGVDGELVTASAYCNNSPTILAGFGFSTIVNNGTGLKRVYFADVQDSNNMLITTSVGGDSAAERIIGVTATTEYVDVILHQNGVLADFFFTVSVAGGK